MKKIVLIAICICGLLSFSSCRSTSDPCGLAKSESKTTQNVQLTKQFFAHASLKTFG